MTDIVTAQAKLEHLRELLAGYGSAFIAFSGGVDSSFLLAVADEVLGDNCHAGTIVMQATPERERTDAVSLGARIGGRHHVVSVDILGDLPVFADNPVDRCYHCKKFLFSRMKQFAANLGIHTLLEGSNASDSGDYRPGKRAIAELGVKSPLLEAGLTKDEIRLLSREMDLPTWDKPALACLATRVPYDQEITRDKLVAIDKAEVFIRERGFAQVRVRHFGEFARIEVDPDAVPKLKEGLAEIESALRSFGFERVEVDETGYRTGSMNENIMGKTGTETDDKTN